MTARATARRVIAALTHRDGDNALLAALAIAAAFAALITLILTLAPATGGAA